MTTHHMKLAATPFAQIAQGDKTVESRLYDEKRQQVALGDTIVFTQADDDTKTAEVQVIGLLRYASFRDMFAHNDTWKFGGENAEDLERQINEFYSVEDQARYGVLGIEFRLQ